MQKSGFFRIVVALLFAGLTSLSANADMCWQVYENTIDFCGGVQGFWRQQACFFEASLQYYGCMAGLLIP